MNILCTLSGHSATPVSLENQGFHFSRCARCSHDMIRSSTLTDARWKPVPEGFRVDWSKVDLSAFKQRSWLGARYDGLAAVVGAARIACTVLAWQMADRLRRGVHHGGHTLAATKRVIRVSQPRLPVHIVVRVSVHHERHYGPQAIAA